MIMGQTRASAAHKYNALVWIMKIIPLVGRKISPINDVFLASAILFISLAGCVTYHRYYASPSLVYLEKGRILVSALQRWGGEPPEHTVEIDSNGTSWGVCVVYYPPKGLSALDFNLRIDSTILRIEELNFEKNIMEAQYVDGNSETSEYTTSLCLPSVRLPSKKYISEVEMSFVLFILDAKTDSILERKPLVLSIKYQKDREFYWGK